MSKLFICSDANFWSPMAAGGINKVEIYNKYLINNWNKTIAEDDRVLIIGNFSSGNLKQTAEVITQLTGTLDIIDYGNFFFSTKFSKNDWKKIGINRVGSVGGWIRDTVNSQVSNVVLVCDPKDFLINADFYAAPNYMVEGGKIWGNADRYPDKKTLNLAIRHWGYTPIEYNSIPKIIENMIVFDKMEEEVKTDVD